MKPNKRHFSWTFTVKKNNFNSNKKQSESKNKEFIISCIISDHHSVSKDVPTWAGIYALLSDSNLQNVQCFYTDFWSLLKWLASEIKKSFQFSVMAVFSALLQKLSFDINKTKINQNYVGPFTWWFPYGNMSKYYWLY